MTECRGDELNIVHVIERPAPPVEHHGAPPVDYLPQPAPTPHEQVVEAAKQFLQARFGTKVQALQPPPVVHLVTVCACAIRQWACNVCFHQQALMCFP